MRLHGPRGALSLRLSREVLLFITVISSSKEWGIRKVIILQNYSSKYKIIRSLEQNYERQPWIRFYCESTQSQPKYTTSCET